MEGGPPPAHTHHTDTLMDYQSVRQSAAQTNTGFDKHVQKL